MGIEEIKAAGLIAVMGGTGTGKSSIINAIIGKDVTDVGHGLESQTSDIKEYDFLMKNGLHVTLVDTPGFNDFTADTGGKSDLVILKEIGAFLKAKYDEGRKFSGILYLHNICDPKVGGSLQRNMTMFKKLCGPDPLKNVVVVTTFWDEIELLQGVEFETELKTKDRFFKGLVEGKSKFIRYGKFPPGEIPKGPEFLPPISIVNELVALDPVFVEMQKELAEGKAVEETSAGAELYKELQELKLQQKKDFINLNQKIAEMKAQNIKDRLAREVMEDESKALKGEIKDWEARQRELHLAVDSGRSEWVSAITQLKQEISAKQRDLELENSHRVELRSEIELLKTIHAKEILEFQFQIRSLLDGNSADAFRKMQLEKTCEDLKVTVSELSLSLTRLRDTSEREAVERIDVMRQCNQLRANAATHEKTLDDLAQLKSQLRASHAAQARTASELHKVKSTLASVKDGAEIAAITQATTLSQLNTVRATLALERRKLELVNAREASSFPSPWESPHSNIPNLPEINDIPEWGEGEEWSEGEEESAFYPPSLTANPTPARQARSASQLHKVKSNLASVKDGATTQAKTLSQLNTVRATLAQERRKLELVNAREASSSHSPWDSPRSNTLNLPGINDIPEWGEGEEESAFYPPSLIANPTPARPPWPPGRTNELRPQSPFHSDPMDASRQQPRTPPVYPDSHAPTRRVTAPGPSQQDHYLSGYGPQPSFPVPRGSRYPFGTPAQLAQYYG